MTGITGVKVAVEVGLNVGVEVLVALIVAVEVGCAVAVGGPSSGAHAASRSMRVSRPNKAIREICVILSYSSLLRHTCTCV